ncbi:MAG: hypothetical protein HC881_10925 [Leptolyngbyaceae cyanobacterium SL_7_1]|nr:hypothetical protein [Leptolyngbyaceae cyanobacterium SL_7_1]
MKEFLRSLHPLLPQKGINASRSAVINGRTPIQWVLPNQLAIGRLPTMALYEPLVQANIQVILSLCAPAEGMLPEIIQHSFECVRYILPDSTYIYPLTVEQLTIAVELVHQTFRQKSQCIYIVWRG